jgi:hypothetical protein
MCILWIRTGITQRSLSITAGVSIMAGVSTTAGVGTDGIAGITGIAGMVGGITAGMATLGTTGTEAAGVIMTLGLATMAGAGMAVAGTVVAGTAAVGTVAAGMAVVGMVAVLMTATTLERILITDQEPTVQVLQRQDQKMLELVENLIALRQWITPILQVRQLLQGQMKESSQRPDQQEPSE